MNTLIPLFLTGQSKELLYLFMYLLPIRLIVTLIERIPPYRSVLIKFFKSEVYNLCLILTCGILDQSVIIYDINIAFNFAALTTLLIIVDEISSILADSKTTVSSKLIQKSIDLLKQSLTK